MVEICLLIYSLHHITASFFCHPCFYFSIPNYYLEKYGEVSNIQAEYYEYRTSPILVLRDDVYETFKNYVGIDIDDITNPGYAICYYSPNTTGQLSYYTYYERNQVLNNVKGNYPFYYSPYITWLFKGGNDGKDEISGDEKVRRIAELRKKAIMDEKDAEYTGYSNGLEEGIKQGKEEGYREGIIKIAKNMKEKKEKIEYIMEITGLGKEEIEKL